MTSHTSHELSQVWVVAYHPLTESGIVIEKVFVDEQAARNYAANHDEGFDLHVEPYDLAGCAFLEEPVHALWEAACYLCNGAEEGAWEETSVVMLWEHPEDWA